MSNTLLLNSYILTLYITGVHTTIVNNQIITQVTDHKNLQYGILEELNISQRISPFLGQLIPQESNGIIVYFWLNA